jgi:hypothetical protein
MPDIPINVRRIFSVPPLRLKIVGDSKKSNLIFNSFEKILVSNHKSIFGPPFVLRIEGTSR